MAEPWLTAPATVEAVKDRGSQWRVGMDLPFGGGSRQAGMGEKSEAAEAGCLFSQHPSPPSRFFPFAFAAETITPSLFSAPPFPSHSVFPTTFICSHHLRSAPLSPHIPSSQSHSSALIIFRLPPMSLSFSFPVKSSLPLPPWHLPILSLLSLPSYGGDTTFDSSQQYQQVGGHRVEGREGEGDVGGEGLVVAVVLDVGGPAGEVERRAGVGALPVKCWEKHRGEEDAWRKVGSEIVVYEMVAQGTDSLELDVAASRHLQQASAAGICSRHLQQASAASICGRHLRHIASEVVEAQIPGGVREIWGSRSHVEVESGGGEREVVQNAHQPSRLAAIGRTNRQEKLVLLTAQAGECGAHRLVSVVLTGW
ncbi:unnamed protein product [Closterium sp. Naga37s-1]|nr:unnamed protein product [Closterium sp. Naga37s-1]